MLNRNYQYMTYLLSKYRILFIVFCLSQFSPIALSSDLKNYSITIDNLEVSFDRFSNFVLPGDTIFITLNNSDDSFTGHYSAGELIYDDSLNWRFISPERSGLYQLEIFNTEKTYSFTLNVFVMIPASDQKGEYLNGYRIGNYPERAFRGLPEYTKPVGFIEVTRENQDVFVSSHYQIKQFICKQQPDHWPKYILMRPQILLKLELLLAKLNDAGIETYTLFLMSAYRTPYYNRTIGNGKYSRHIYGDATDVYVDTNNDGVIDDLNRDKKASMLDADVIYKIVDTFDKDPKYKFMLGGLGKYKKTNSHTWNVHLDTRGYKARW